jgi:hypothetical protein
MSLVLPAIMSKSTPRIEKRMVDVEFSKDALPILVDTPKKRRGGWWDATQNKEDDMNRIKQMIQARKVASRPLTEERQQRVEVEGQESAESHQAPAILCKIETTEMQSIEAVAQEDPKRPSKPARKITLEPIEIPKREDLVFRPEKESHVTAPKVPTPPEQPIAAPAAERSNRKKKKPWVTDILQEGIEENHQRPPTPQRPKTPKSPVPKEHAYDPKTPPKPNKSFQASKLKEIVFDESVKSSVDPLSVYEYLVDKRMEQSAEAFLVEANIPPEALRALQLRRYVEKKDFGRAVVLVQSVLQLNQDSSLIPSLEDLIYVLSKYLLIYLHQLGQLPIADRTLKMVIWPMVQKEQQRGGIRSDWFTKDYFLLNNLLSDTVIPENVYHNLNWNTELQKFWDSMQMIDLQQAPPLFAYALAAYFRPVHFTSLEECVVSHKKLERVKRVLKEENRGNARHFQAKMLPEDVNKQPLAVKCSYPAQTEPLDEFPRRLDSGGMSVITSSTNQSKSRYLQDDLPPLSHEAQNSNFALTKVCGPLQSVRVMDVQTAADTGQVIAVTAGLEKDITVWDIKQNSIISTLQNTSTKPIVIVRFHPAFPELLLSADMENDIKLWNWKESSMVRWWRKHHSRIIYQIGFIPGDDTRCVSCSGDQSLKMYIRFT